MVFYILAPGDIIKSGDHNSNYNETIYAILYNRMENDAQATAPQLNANIQSDLFCCAAGKYSTVCTAETTSTFSTNLYNNTVSVNEFYNSCLFLCCSYTCGSVSPPAVLCNNYTTSFLCQSVCHRCSTNGGFGASNLILNFCNSFNLGNYRCLIINLTGTSSYIQCDYSTVTNCSYTCLSIGGDVYSCSTSTTPTSINYGKCYIINGNCYDVYINGSCCCTISPTTLNLLFCSSTTHTINSGTATSSAYFLSFKCIEVIVNTYATQNTKIQSNLKTYATPKGSVVLSTVSTLPAGNCIRYNIKNQAGTVLLHNASPDAVYSLSSPACCLYAEIYQCVECNLCTPQCMTQYALMYM